MTLRAFALILALASLAAVAFAQPYKSLELDEDLKFGAAGAANPVFVGQTVVCWTDIFGSPGVFGQCDPPGDGSYVVNKERKVTNKGLWLSRSRKNLQWVRAGDLASAAGTDCRLAIKDGIGPFQYSVNGNAAVGHWVYSTGVGYVVWAGEVYEVNQDFVNGQVLCNSGPVYGGK